MEDIAANTPLFVWTAIARALCYARAPYGILRRLTPRKSTATTFPMYFIPQRVESAGLPGVKAISADFDGLPRVEFTMYHKLFVSAIVFGQPMPHKATN
jgi:hypothetical protein